MRESKVMSESLDNWDSQWRMLLTHSYEKVEADQEFRSRLLQKMKNKAAEAKQRETGETAEQKPSLLHNDQVWSEFLSKTYPECSARKGFKTNLLSELKEKAQIAAPAKVDDIFSEDQFAVLLSEVYEPVQPRPEFQTRLLTNLKERQQTSIKIKEQYRRRSIFSSFASGLAAAAAVLFVVWAAPFNSGAQLQTSERQSRSVIYDDEDYSSTMPLPQSDATAVPDAYTQFPAAALDSSTPNYPNASSFLPVAYNTNEAFGSSPLPKTVRGTGMEINDGSGWRDMDESGLTRIAPGMAFRSLQQTAGLGFSDGSTILMWPDAQITATENGFSVDQGQLAVTVPDGSDGSFRINLPERDIAIEPGTMLAVNAYFPDRYALGGAPAPEVKVLDGGLAIARGKSGDAPLLANQVYLLDNYVTPDIPGRPMCAAECAELEDFSHPSARQLAGTFGLSANASQMVANTAAVPESSAGPRGYSKKGDKWVSNTYSGQPVVKIQYLSDTYFGLAKERRDLASALSLGSNVILDAGDGVFYEIHR